MTYTDEQVNALVKAARAELAVFQGDSFCEACEVNLTPRLDRDAQPHRENCPLDGLARALAPFEGVPA